MENSYKVLYRKYRPDNFENLVGQTYVSKILKNSIIENKISHAYIFSGPRGTGKTSTAKIFAKSINCLDNQNGEACGKCVNCINFLTNTDIIEIDAASNNGVDQIREITNNIKLAPTMSRFKVYIIDEVHMLSASAFNALLLTLEEPPSHVVFILATTNIENVPVTILSRCQRFDFKKIKEDDIVSRLKYICEQEKITIDDDALKEIAYISDGGLRDALSLLDQLSKDNTKITIDMVIKEIGSVSSKSIDVLLDLLENNDYAGVIKQIDEFRQSSLDYKLIIKKIIDLSTKRAIKIVETGKFKRISYDKYKNLVFSLTDCLNKINVNVDSYSLIELILLELIDNPVKKHEIDKIVTNKESQEPEYSKNNEQSNILIENMEIRINNCFANCSKEEKINAQNLWTNLKNETKNNLVKGLIADTNVAVASKDILVVSSKNEHFVADFNDENLKISEEITALFNKNIRIVAVSDKKWQTLAKKFADDYRNGIKYQVKDEKVLKNKTELENIATNLFASDKIEKD